MKPEIIYEDDAILVCYKPAGVPTQTKRFGQADMESILKNYRASKKEEPYIGIVHRLDQPVEGVMVFGKTKQATAILSKQVRERTIGKNYYAIGKMEPDANPLSVGEKGTLLNELTFDQKTNVSAVYPVDADVAGAKKAKLDYEVLATWQEGGAYLALFDITLHTGRHHQIRLQLKDAGYPLLGDAKYATAKPGEQLALCSYRIAFLHPKTGKAAEYTIQPHHAIISARMEQ